MPPLFATSVVGYNRESDYALLELQPEILQLIKLGIRTTTFTGDPLHDNNPLPSHLFTNSAGVLYHLSKTLNNKHLRWRNLPNIVRQLTKRSNYLNSTSNEEDQTVIQSDETEIQPEFDITGRNKSLIAHVKKFKENRLLDKKILDKQIEPTSLNEVLNKNLNVDSISVFEDFSQDTTWTEDRKERDAMEIEQKALEAYTLQAELGMINVLEGFVFAIIRRMVNPDIYANLNISEAVAYTLNRFPPMYATSERGFKYLLRKAVIELSRELSITARTGVIKIMNRPRSNSRYSLFSQYAQEHELALAELNKILNRDDISLNNVLKIVQDLVAASSVNNLN